MKFCKLTIIFLAFLTINPTVFGQDEEQIRVETNLVSVNVMIKDAKGVPVKALKPEQFEIFDNRQKQQISHFSNEEAPVTFGIVYDTHPTTAERTQATLAALRQFVKELRAEDRFFLIVFNERGSLSLDFVPTVEQLEKHLLDSREPNSLYDAIYLAAEKLRDSRNLKRTLIVVSDSADHRSRHSFSNLSQRLKGLDVQVYAVIFDDNNNWFYRDVTGKGKRRLPASSAATSLERAAIEDLALKSGGTTYSPISEDSQRLYEIYKEIAGEMRAQYTVSFYPTARDGKWHDLRVNVHGAEGSKKFALTYRQGYQSHLQKTKNRAGFA